jgi:hypothetical protein
MRPDRAPTFPTAPYLANLTIADNTSRWTSVRKSVSSSKERCRSSQNDVAGHA